jgi:hypothetical protein
LTSSHYSLFDSMQALQFSFHAATMILEAQQQLKRLYSKHRVESPCIADPKFDHELTAKK